MTRSLNWKNWKGCRDVVVSCQDRASKRRISTATAAAAAASPIQKKYLQFLLTWIQDHYPSKIDSRLRSVRDKINKNALTYVDYNYAYLTTVKDVKGDDRITFDRAWEKQKQAWEDKRALIIQRWKLLQEKRRR